MGLGTVLPARIGFPAIRTSKTLRGPKGKGPMLVCSRGEKWGTRVTEPGFNILSKGGNILDAVEKSANVVELDPEDTSVGYGGLPNEDGVVQLDASMMHGPTHNCGSVASLEGIKTPCSVARLVMERTDHMFLVGPGAQHFAVMHGFKVENLLTEKARLIWLKWKENLSDKDDWFPAPEGVDYNKKRITGTINVFALAENGDVAGVTTTSGLAFKIPGRIGDSPIIGAGLYLDNEVGAAGATGRGEEVIRTLGSYFVVEQMRQGKSPMEACKAACEKIVAINKRNGVPIDFNDKFIAMNKKGEIGCYAILGSKKHLPMVSWRDADGFHTLEGGYLFERKRN
ncbi:MAG: asparaginase [Calditrichaeota bacterium]|nr:MAG: asparaginase [Calditrichota bacterium]